MATDPEQDNENVQRRSGPHRRPEKGMALAPKKSLFVSAEKSPEHPPTSYTETIVHLLKGNIGPGLFAMGDAFKNGGFLVAPILLVVIGVICIHCQHILVNCSEKMRVLRDNEDCSDYADTVEQCLESGPERYRSWSKGMKAAVNIFICVTQLGFCCIYFVFISTNVRKILLAYDIDIDLHLVMVIAFVPIVLTSLITNLKWLTPVSLIANICMIAGLGITMFFALKDGIPNASDRKPYTSPPQLALFFGTAIFAFEGIALVLPLKNAMEEPRDFERPLGVLNVGMFLVTSMFLFGGLVGYLNWGEDVGASLTFNLGDTVLAQFVQGIVSLGVLFGYPIQFFIAIQIMWPCSMELLHLQHKPFTGELFFRTGLVLVTLCIAELVPALGLFISLIGALCSTALALVFPPLIELLVERSNYLIFGKNVVILILALLGFATGTYESLHRIITHFDKLADE